jgi:hypothetical protein
MGAWVDAIDLDYTGASPLNQQSDRHHRTGLDWGLEAKAVCLELTGRAAFAWLDHNSTLPAASCFASRGDCRLSTGSPLPSIAFACHGGTKVPK